MEENDYTVPIAVIVGGIIIALAVYFAVAERPAGKVTVSGVNASLVRPVDTSDHILGNPSAEVMIIEYSDFDCTFCKDFDKTLHEIVATSGATGKVAWIFRHFPLTEIHPNSLKKAEAAECAAIAGGNDAFWAFASELFKNQPADLSRLGEYAKVAGVPSDTFAKCYADASKTVEARVMSDRKNALDIGAQGTPFSVILVQGKDPLVISSAYSYDAVKTLVDQALSN